MDLKALLAAKSDQLLAQLSSQLPEADLYADIVLAASEFFDYSRGGVDDFCIQRAVSYPSVIIFGGVNRLQWSVKRGFRFSRSHCTKRFIERFVDIMGSAKEF